MKELLNTMYFTESQRKFPKLLEIDTLSGNGSRKVENNVESLLGSESATVIATVTILVILVPGWDRLYDLGKGTNRTKHCLAAVAATAVGTAATAARMSAGRPCVKAVIDNRNNRSW
ncbi:hypothetical protein HZH68_002236 [Vespula germanica]|uniref:Uncharacterized protein n=2 Tax=Vespula TaxID=7451 RepID=A0A834NLC5_VESGE|nr:hypothetical protein HZH66_002001 [Vespula vulgaris]KAF7413747.1 hypothetical protein HZH68_002236 [Vespula germanica]